MGEAQPGWQVIAAVIALPFVVVGGCVAVDRAIVHSPQNIRHNVIEACQDTLRRELRDPSSAQFAGWIVSTGGTASPGLNFHPENGDAYYFATGTVNAKNGFGAYVGGKQYACDAVVTSDNDIRATTYAG